jgi:hypothetical protein
VPQLCIAQVKGSKRNDALIEAGLGQRARGSSESLLIFKVNVRPFAPLSRNTTDVLDILDTCQKGSDLIELPVLRVVDERRTIYSVLRVETVRAGRIVYDD